MGSTKFHLRPMKAPIFEGVVLFWGDIDPNLGARKFPGEWSILKGWVSWVAAFKLSWTCIFCSKTPPFIHTWLVCSPPTPYLLRWLLAMTAVVGHDVAFFRAAVIRDVQVVTLLTWPVIMPYIYIHIFTGTVYLNVFDLYIHCQLLFVSIYVPGTDIDPLWICVRVPSPN